MVESVAVSAVLMAHNARNAEGSLQRTAKFVPAFFDATSEHLLKRYTKWEVNWPQPCRAGRACLQQRSGCAGPSGSRHCLCRRASKSFCAKRGRRARRSPTGTERKKLFDEFVRWTRKSVGETEAQVRR